MENGKEGINSSEEARQTVEKTREKPQFDGTKVKENITASKAGTSKQCEPIESASVPHETLNQPLQDGDLRIRCHEDLQSQAQQLVDDINAKRKRDTDLLNNFRKALDTQANNSCSAVEEEMVKMYQLQSKVIEAKFDELFSVLDRISKLQNELMEFKEALGLLYKDANTF